MDPDQFWRQTPATFGAATRGRAKANIENIITLAHQIETMSRQGKKLRSLDHYLKSPAKKQGPDDGVFAALKMAEAKGLVTIRERAV